MRAFLIRTLPLFVLANFAMLYCFNALDHSVKGIAFEAIKQNPRWQPVYTGGDGGPPLEMFHVVWIAALFLTTPWIAYQIRRVWFPASDWRIAQIGADCFLAGGAIGHFLLFPWLLRIYPFDRPTPSIELWPLACTLHTRTVLGAAIGLTMIFLVSNGRLLVKKQSRIA